MSSASTTRTIKFISKAGTYMATIMSPWGDLYQEWEGSQSAPSSLNIFPKFDVEKPILYFVCTSSRVAEGLTTPASINFYFNDTLIEFNASTNVSTGMFAGLFKKIYPDPTNGQPYFGLQIIQNIVVTANFAPAVIKMVAGVEYGTQSDQIQASYNIPIQQSTGTSYRVTIAAGDTKNFVINEKNGSCILRARVFKGASEITTNLSYVWEKLDPTNASTGWSNTGVTTQTLTVNENDIQTYAEYRVTVSQNGQELGSDIQGVMDSSDPYDIDPNPNPKDETIDEDPSGNGSVTYTPVVVTRGTTTPALSTLFLFVARDAVGTLLTKVSGTPQVPAASASFTVTRDMCIQAQGDVSLTISSVD